MDKLVETFFNWDVMAQYAPKIVDGFFVTVWLAALVVVTGLAAGLLLALLRSFRFRAASFFILAVPKGRLEAARQAQSVTCNATPIVAAGIIYVVCLWPLVRLLSRFEHRQISLH